jgi:hypothetical protein
MQGVRNTTCVLAVALATAAAGCGGGGDPVSGLAESVDRARAANTLNSLQTGLVTLSLVQVDSAGGDVQDLAAALQSKDPTHRYTTARPTVTGVVQVLGGAGGPVMLVAISDLAAEGRPAHYVAAWQGSGTTMYYAGTSPPAYTPEPPAGAGWGSTLPQ